MVTGCFSQETVHDRINIVYFYEQISKLIEATHIIFTRREFKQAELAETAE